MAMTVDPTRQMLGRSYDDGHEVYAEPSPRRVRVRFGGEWIADSTRALLLFETRRTPVYYLHRDDVRTDFLEASERTAECAYRGTATYWTLRVNGRESPDAAWGYQDPKAGQEHLRDFIAFSWNRVDHWYEEDEEVLVHPRDPYKRVDILPSQRRVEVVVGGEVVADSTNALWLFETSLPTRYYIPQTDVRLELLTPTDSSTQCPYKGTARYWSLEAGGETFEDIAWGYQHPTRESAPIAGLICFYNERVDEIRIDGEPQAVPESPWSRT